jgi:uncharacterized membrane protein
MWDEAASAGTESGFTTAMEHIAQAFEALGALILVIGVFWSVTLALVVWRRTRVPGRAYATIRQAFGGSLLLALEVLVAADLLRTVAVAPSIENVLALGLIVVIRTFLSFSLEIEIDGVPPWRRALSSGAGTVRRATQASFKEQSGPGE